MARFRTTRHLSCFYCGRRSGHKNDGAMRDFECRHCEATNYLDENGEITDPPVATEREAAATQQYAAPKPPGPADSIFCATCLKNQHLFTTSLAQYLPDDPADPDYAPLERNYHRYRRGLEKRYPQVCDECAGRVEARMREAGYAAKTDHLRRMMDLGRGRRRGPAPARSALDYVDRLGAAVWRAGFALQLLWHAAAVAPLLAPLCRGDAGDGLRDPDEAGCAAAAVAAAAWLARVASALPAPDALMRWSLAAAVAAAWWNPYFVQLTRGFTRHLTGFAQWYSFQGLVVLFRLASRSVGGMQGSEGQSYQAQLSAHLAMAAVMALIYVLAGRSIRVDTAPLFGVGAGVSASPRSKEAPTPPTRGRSEAPKTLSELLNEALESAPGTPHKQGQRPQKGLSPTPPFPRGQTINSASAGFATPIGAPNHQPQPVQYAEEMDWSPITPGHRAFASQPSPSRGTGVLGQEAGQGKKNPFWYKVPAAPLNPARQLRNPPRAPEPKPAAVDVNRVTFGRVKTGERGRGETSADVEFRQPQFFAPERDDASSLADLLNQSFSLSQDQDQETDDGGGTGEDDGPGGDQGESRRASASAAPSAAMSGFLGAGASHSGLFEPLALAALAVTWALTLLPAAPYRTECQTGVMAAAGLIAFGGTGETRRGPSAAAHLLAAWAAAELAAACWAGSALWRDGEAAGARWCGPWVLVMMMARLALRRLFVREG